LGEYNILTQGLLQFRNDLVLALLWVHVCKRIVVLENNHCTRCSGSPNAEHSVVDYVGEGALGIVSISLPLCRRIATPPKKPPFSSSKSFKTAHPTESIISPFESLKVSRKGGEVLWLESSDHPLREFGLLGEGVGLASVVASVSELLTHESVIVMTVVWPFRDNFISLEVSSPSKIRPAKPCNRCMNVSRFDSVEVFPVIEKVPFYCSDDVALTALRVELGELAPSISDEYASKTFLHVLKVSASAKFAEARAKPASVCSSDVVGCSHSSVIVYSHFECFDFLGQLS